MIGRLRYLNGRTQLLRLVIALLAVLALGSLGRAAEPSADDTLQALALRLVNQARDAEGLPPLEPAANLGGAAEMHAQDMLRRHYYSHTSPDGEDVQDRLVQTGGSRWQMVAENIARCGTCTPPATETMVRMLQDGWMNSPEHRENILREGIDRFGFALAIGADRGLYAVQTFAGPGEPQQGRGGEARQALAEAEVAVQAASILNEQRQTAGAPALSADNGLSQAARRLTPSGEGELSLGGDGVLREALPSEQRHRWRQLRVLAGACGGCGIRPTVSDLQFFIDQWLKNPEQKQRLLSPEPSAIGAALQANGQGRKTLTVVLGTPQ
jgi:uncharacterized protein YkwD